ncbi:MAG: hypothetical protein OEV74_08270 [Cyclobacteriaceae bacterium]|nr:hypothetical protein [Cyclobacteriaceae bacterium]
MKKKNLNLVIFVVAMFVMASCSQSQQDVESTPVESGVLDRTSLPIKEPAVQSITELDW